MIFSCTYTFTDKEQPEVIKEPIPVTEEIPEEPSPITEDVVKEEPTPVVDKIVEESAPLVEGTIQESPPINEQIVVESEPVLEQATVVEDSLEETPAKETVEVRVARSKHLSLIIPSLRSFLHWTNKLGDSSCILRVEKLTKCSPKPNL